MARRGPVAAPPSRIRPPAPHPRPSTLRHTQAGPVLAAQPGGAPPGREAGWRGGPCGIGIGIGARQPPSDLPSEPPALSPPPFPFLSSSGSYSNFVWGRGLGGAVPGRNGDGYARGRARRGAHNMEIPGTPPPSPILACGRRRPASKPKEADFRLRLGLQVGLRAGGMRGLIEGFPAGTSRLTHPVHTLQKPQRHLQPPTSPPTRAPAPRGARAALASLPSGPGGPRTPAR